MIERGPYSPIRGYRFRFVAPTPMSEFRVDFRLFDDYGLLTDEDIINNAHCVARARARELSVTVYPERGWFE